MFRLTGFVIAMLFTAVATANKPTQTAFVRPTMQGQQIDVGGRYLHLHCTGTGPTVVIEAAAATWTSHYVAVQKAIASFAHVCTYDRAGLGWSEPAPTGRSIQDMANDLNALLKAAKLRIVRIRGHYVRSETVRASGNRADDERCCPLSGGTGPTPPRSGA